MHTINWLGLFVVIFASFRITHLIVFDEIAAFIRKPFLEIVTQKDSNGEEESVLHPKGKGLRHFIGKLLSCYWCTGFWCSVAVVLIYLYVPVMFPILLIFAVAGASSMIESKI
ncbi:MAG: DUF1360 domain-containing protein [Bacillota bacterium]|nr:DUF1360 domain-containing protein [Bacillota bacterium]